MKRTYDTGEAKDIVFFTGVEVEKTPAFGMKTLFVTGVQDYYAIRQKYINEECTHIFFGANHSYNPVNSDDFNQWDALITLFLKDDNTMVKIDDKGFNASNPGVWCHSLHDLMDRDKFTDWSKYGLDKVLK